MNTSKLIQPDLEVENIQPENGVKFTEAELDRLIGFPRITIPLAVEEDTFCVNDDDEGDQLLYACRSVRVQRDAPPLPIPAERVDPRTHSHPPIVVSPSQHLNTRVALGAQGHRIPRLVERLYKHGRMAH